MRWYVHAHQDKLSHRDWRQIVLKAYAPDRAACVVQDLEGDPAYPEREDKARRFVELMGSDKGASRATYFRVRKRLEEEGRLVVEGEMAQVWWLLGFQALSFVVAAAVWLSGPRGER